MVKLNARLGKGYWLIEHKGKLLKRKVIRMIKGNYVVIDGKKYEV